MAASGSSRGMALKPKGKRSRATVPGRKEQINMRPEVWGPLFLDTYRKTHKLQQSADLVGVHISTVYKRRDKDPEFGAQFWAIQDGIRAAVEDEIYHRAIEGDITVEPIFFKGDNDEEGMPIVSQVGTKVIVKKSDRMLELLAKSLMPEKYAERSIVYNVDLSAEVRRVAEDQNVPAELVANQLNASVKRLIAAKATDEGTATRRG